ncbi:alpha/beta fold hydrolase [Planctomonas sp. JC2975]|nr:alpha/beta fold hydrolase [Planctomonas sp. JC2975]NNC11435.1 alpha/beta fold hydrolase [Planctomonas sp. JC2975]
MTRPGSNESRRKDEAPIAFDWGALPSGAVKDAVAAPSGQLARLSLGPADGVRIVLAPGVTGSKEDFSRMAPLMADAGYRAESYDLAGQYESHSAGPENLDPPGRHYTLDLFVDDLLAVIGTGSTPVHLVGYSFAGTVAAMVAARHPGLVASLALLSTPPLAGQSLRGFKVVGPLSGPISPHVCAGLMIWGTRRNLNRSPRERIAFVRERFEMTRRSSVDDIIGLMKGVPDLDDELRASGIPLLVAVGTRDVWPVRMHRAYAERIGARLSVLDTGHTPNETAPYQLTDEILANIRR